MESHFATRVEYKQSLIKKKHIFKRQQVAGQAASTNHLVSWEYFILFYINFILRPTCKFREGDTRSEKD